MIDEIMEDAESDVEEKEFEEGDFGTPNYDSAVFYFTKNIVETS